MRVEAPTLSGTFDTTNRLAPLPEPGDLLSGVWRPEEVRSVRHALGSVVMYGECLADDQAIAGTLDQALHTGNLTLLTHLPGSYTTLLFQPEKLVVLADLAGQYPFYYRQRLHALDFASTAAPLGGPSTKPDLLTLAARLVLPAPGELVAGRSAIDGISRLEAGHTLVAARDGTVNVAPYETFQTPTTTSLDEAAALLRQALLESARLRALSGRTLSADMSGGLDSTTAAYLLARHVDEPLLVATKYTPGCPSEDLDQVRRLLALPASEGQFDAREYEQTSLGLPYATLAIALPGDEPDVGSTGAMRDTAYARFLRQNGSEVHITGTAADCLFDLPAPYYLGGLARPGSYGRFARSAIEAGRTYLASPWQLARESWQRSGVDPVADMHMLSRVLLGDQTAQALRHGGWLFGPESAPQWLTPDARRQLAGLAEERAAAITVPDGFDYGNYNAYLALRDIGHHQHGAMQRVAADGLRRRALFLDNAILRACLNLPSHARVNPWVFKALLAKATQGLLPPEVTNRSTKGNYTAQLTAGLRAARPSLQGLLHDSRLAAYGIIEPQAVQQTMDRIDMDGAVPLASLQQFAAIEHWLRCQENSEPPLLQPSRPLITATYSPQKQPLVAPAAQYGMKPQTCMVTCPTGAVVLDISAGKYLRLDVHARNAVRALQNAGNFDDAARLLQNFYPDVAPDVLRPAFSDAVHQLVARGILAEGSTAFDIAEGTADQKYTPLTMTRQNHETSKARLRDYPAAIGGLALALMTQRMPIARRLALVDKVHRSWAKRSLPEAKGTQLLAAVQRISSHHIGRAACLEVSMATVLAAALKRRRLNLVLGVATDPDSFHAWPEAEGVAVRTANDPEIVGVFDGLVRV